MSPIVGIYIRLDLEELLRLRDHPEVLPKYDPRVALGDGRGLDIGRAWEELGAFFEGGIKVPESGPTVGEVAMNCDDQRATWSYVEPERVVVFADKLRLLRRAQFRQRYDSDGEDTLTIPGTMTGNFGDREKYMYDKLRKLARHYADAAERGQGMLVRIGARV